MDDLPSLGGGKKVTTKKDPLDFDFDDLEDDDNDHKNNKHLDSKYSKA